MEPRGQIRWLPHSGHQRRRRHPFFTKNGFDWTAKYQPLAAEAAALEAESFIIEGETIVTNDAGLSDFRALRSAITRRPQDLYLVGSRSFKMKGPGEGGSPGPWPCTRYKHVRL